MAKFWVGVASRDHVDEAVAGGFAQVNHGKEAPLKRLSRGDGLLFYSPRGSMGAGEPLKAFTAIGRVVDDHPYQAEQTAIFKPFRRKVDYAKTKAAPITPLLKTLSFTRGGKNWGQVMRRGFFEIQEADYDLIAVAMGVPKGVQLKPGTASPGPLA